MFIFIFTFIICFYLHGDPFAHISQTFLLYSHFRKGVRYHEKMAHMANALLTISKESSPNDTLKLNLFYSYLKKNSLCSYTPGFTVKPPYIKEDLILKQDSLEQSGPMSSFYGVGPSSRYFHRYT